MLSKHSLVYLSLILLILALGILSVYHFADSAAIPTPTSPAIQSAQTSQTDEQIRQAIQKAIDEEKDSAAALLIYDTQIENIRISSDGNWATAWLVPVDPETGQIVPSEPGLALVHRLEDGWKAFLPSDPLWSSVVREVPDDLIPPSEKSVWMQVADFQARALALGPFRGYKLPWAGGDTLNLTQSVGHDRYTPSGSAHYAFDFSKSGYPSGMFNVHAARGGIVRRVVWSNPNGNETNSNYIVLEDSSTNPTTYQLYMHLAKDSIPTALRAVGAPVRAGQFVGIADDTGISSGNHLHFMVHTTSTSYWGTSVDITFDEVTINGGRPRILSDRAYCRSTDICTSFQTSYISNNFMVPDHIPPTGGIKSPAQGSLVTTSILTLQGWATDNSSGLASAQFIARLGSDWVPIGSSYSTNSFTYNWDLCNANVPDGPISLALTIKDKALNQAPGLPGLTHITKNFTCPTPPSACVPTASQVALHAGRDYQGQCVLLNAGSFTLPTQLGKLGDDNAASIQVGSNVQATLFSNSNLLGRAETFFANDSSLIDNPIGLDTTSSVLVQTRSSLPGVPTPIWPANNASFFSDASFSLVWENTKGATQYQLRLLTGSTQLLLTDWINQSEWHLSGLTPGSYSWQIKARNANGESNWSASNAFSIQTGPVLPAPIEAPYSDGMEPPASSWTSLNWTITSEANHTPGGASSWKYYLSGGGGYDNGQPNAGYLTSPAISLPPTGSYYLRFWYQYQTESSELNWDQRWLQISVDGSPFTNLLQLSDDPMNFWLRSPIISLAPYAGRSIRVRFYFTTLDNTSNQYKGWYIDDFSISTDPPPACSDTDNSFLQANQMSYNQPIHGVICPGGDMDYYKFQGVAGDQIGIRTEAQAIGSPLDTEIALIDSDGHSVIKENDDQVQFVRSDSAINYLLSRTGTYFIKVQAWNHPDSGDTDHVYTLSLYKDLDDPTASFSSPLDGGTLTYELVNTTVAARDTGSGVSHVQFFWHSNDWLSSEWIYAGEDWDSTDGWNFEFKPASPAGLRGGALYAAVYDWAGNWVGAGAWNLHLPMIYLPVVYKSR